MTSEAPVTPGLVKNRAQFLWLSVNVLLVGGMLGTERTVVPLLGRDVYHVMAALALSFIASFGLTKALVNMGAGRWSDSLGRRPLLIAGWLAAIPLVLLLLLVHAWWAVVVANVLLGANQGLAWTMTVTAQLDLVRPDERGLSMGVNEAMGYLGVALATVGAGLLSAHGHLTTRPFYLAGAIVLVGGVQSVAIIRETRGHVPPAPAAEGVRSFARVLADTTWRHPALSSLTVGGFVNKLADTVAWGLLPLYFANAHESLPVIALLSGLYAGVWGLGQFGTGLWSDHTGRKPLIVAGLLLVGLGLLAMILVSGTTLWAAAAATMGIGMALAYPVLNAAVADVAPPHERGAVLGVYRLWRDGGYAVGGVGLGLLLAAAGMRASLLVVSLLVLAAAVFIAWRLPETHRVAAR